ncbi:metal-dependent hydrolase [Candidatus Bathyarchaeota archaeon]|nr:metal-dependent hydrolase [Candidatus Bathyarchaeota archaeon]
MNSLSDTVSNEVRMYPLGHFALGYFAAYIIGRLTGEETSIPVVWFLSVAPDIDVLIPFLEHRGPTHSVVVMALLFLPVYIASRRWLPYFAALLSHPLVGDYFTGYGCKVFWPLSDAWIAAPWRYRISSRSLFVVEGVLFAAMAAFILLKHLREPITRAEYTA